MDSSLPHAARVAELCARVGEATTRLTARLARAGARAEQATSGWTPAQVGAHVALVNNSLASVIDGTVGAAVPAAAGYVERAWTEIATGIPEKNVAPMRMVPADDVSLAAALAELTASAGRLTQALQALTPVRGTYCFTNRVVGTITLYQVGEFAVAHMIRHNQQVKRILGE